MIGVFSYHMTKFDENGVLAHALMVGKAQLQLAVESDPVEMAQSGRS